MTRSVTTIIALLCLLACSPSRVSAPAPVPDVVPAETEPETEPEAPATLAPLTIDMDRRGPAHVTNLPVPATTLAPGAFCPLYAQVVCRKIFACAEPDSIAADAESQRFSDEAGCQDALGRFCGAFVLAGVEDSVKAGRVEWDGPGFAQCFQAWTGLACAPPFGDLPATRLCRDSSVGTVKPGGMCTSAFDCVTIESAEIACTFREGVVEGTCVRLGDETVTCEFSNDCRSDLRCRTGHCLAPGKPGEPCLFADDCVQGLVCPDDGRCAANPQQR